MGSCLLQNYTAEEYKGDSQNWCIAQDNRGIMYFGNTSRILEFDGKSWNTFYNSKKSVVRSLAIDKSGIIYVGGSGEFGYLKANKSGKLQYINLSDSIKEEVIFQDVWKIIESETGIYFFTNNQIFKWYNDKIQVLKIKTTAFFGNKIKNQIYIVDRLRGIYKLVDTTAVLLENSATIVKKAGFVHILEGNEINTLFIVTSNNGLYTYNTETFEVIKIESKIEEYLIENTAYAATRIDSDLYAIGTAKGGILVIDANGKLIRIINKKRGLLTDCIYYIYADKDKNLWAGLQNGISRIDISYPISKFGDTQGIDDYVLDVEILNNTLIVASMNYSFFLPSYNLKLKSDNHEFKTFNNSGGIWDLFKFKNHLIGVGYNGIFEYKDTTVQNLSWKGDIIFCGKSTFKFPDYIFVGMKTGLAYVKTEEKSKNDLLKVDSLVRINQILEEIRYITCDTSGNLWISTKFDGIYYLKFNGNNVEDFELTLFNQKNGLSDLKSCKAELVNDEIKILTRKGIYKPIFPADKKENDSLTQFVHDNIFGKTFTTDSSEITEVFTLDKNRYMYYSDVSSGIIDISGDSVKIDSLFLKRLPSIARIQFNGENQFYICNSSALYIYDLTKFKNFKSEFQTFIRKVKINSDSVIFFGTFFNYTDNKYFVTENQTESFIPVFDYEFNSITIEFSSNCYEDAAKTEYSYFLENFDDSWSNWSTENKAVFTNIPEGKYIFKVKAKNVYGIETNLTEYTFTIKPPWYRTWWAYILWLLLLLVVVITLVKINTLRLELKNKKLEKIVEERTSQLRAINLEVTEKNEELLQQKEEILAQSEELHSQTEELQVINSELEKLSIVASETDNAVLIFDNNLNLEWVNNAFYRLYGYSLEEIQYKSIIELSSNDNINNIVDECVKFKKSISYEALVLTKAKIEIWIHTTITPIFDFDGSVSKLIAVESNIHELKLAQKELAIKNKLVTSSINYAVTIQNAILPLRKDIEPYFKYFIIYRAKDVVSGDFYWFSRTEIHGTEFFYAAVLDCTGHGVPGAFMSLIGNRLLNEIIIERKVYETNEILDALDKGIKKALRQNSSESIDGMDVAICKIEKQDNEKVKVIFSGAKQPLLYFSQKQNELTKIKGDIRRIGGFNLNPETIMFNVTEIILEKGDMIYLKSDGFEDQCDYSRKKFGKGKLKRMFSEIAVQSIEYQQNYLENELDKWQLEIDQRDDITIFGIKV